MNWFKNLKIGAKLATGFGLIIILVVVLAAYSITTARSIDSNYTYLIEYPQQRYDTVMNINVNFIATRRALSHMSLYSGAQVSASDINAQLKIIDNLISLINSDLDKYNTSVNNDTRLTSAQKQERLTLTSSTKTLLSQYYNNLVTPATQAYLAGNTSEVLNLATKYASVSNDLLSNLDDLTQKAKSIVDSLNDSTSVDANRSIMILIVLSAVTIILSILLALVITGYITKPIRKLVTLVADVSRGNLNINTDKASITKDETGELTMDVYALVDVIKNIISDLTKMTNDIMVKGDSDQRIEASKYSGSYLEMTTGINSFADGYLSEIALLLDQLEQIGNGNFNADMKKFPGKKATINTRLDSLKTNLKNLYAEMSSLAENAVVGKLDVRADAGRYKGDWAALLNVLNNLMTAISAPIQEAAEVLQAVSAGNFDNKMNGSYKGDFLIIKNSINNTVANIASYIDEISRVLTALSDKNLDQSITREYVGKFSNIKNALNNIIDTLNNVISDIASAADQVSAGAKQISESSMTLAQGATEQASSVEELNATVLTINENTTQNAGNAKEAEHLSDISKKNANRGQQDMDSMLTSMDGIKESSNKISQIIKTIDNIAFQTNLLALNAAVEAARAGENGRGFAVVAEEVRNLAAKSQDAAKNTSALIEESILKVTEGTKIAGQTADALRTIVDDVAHVSDIITGISASSQEQAIAIGQVTIGLSQITEVVQSNSATSEESASASQELSSQAETLKGLVDAFKLKKGW